MNRERLEEAGRNFMEIRDATRQGVISGRVSDCVQVAIREISQLLPDTELAVLAPDDSRGRLLDYREELRALRGDIEQGEDAAEQAHRLVREILLYVNPDIEIREHDEGKDK